MSLIFYFYENSRQIIWKYGQIYIPLHSHSRNTGCSSVRLEYASGGRVVAGSNPVIPTKCKASIINDY